MRDEANRVPMHTAATRFSLPILQWLPQYERSWLRFDLIAGITLAAYAIPVSLAYASLAGCRRRWGCIATWSAAWATRCSARRGIWRSAPRPRSRCCSAFRCWSCRPAICSVRRRWLR